METVALYYPYMIPPTAWMKQALLTADTISSIVHYSVGRPLSGDLAWVNEKGLWAGTDVRDFGRIPDYLDEIERALETFCASPAMRFKGNSIPAPSELERIYVSKLTHRVEDLLLSERFAKLGRFGGSLLVHRSVLQVVLAITAKYVAVQDVLTDRRIILSTDAPSAARLAHDPVHGRPTYAETYELLLDGFTPAPGDRASLADVIEFRERYRAELLQYRTAMDDLVADVQQAAQPLEAIRSGRQEIDFAMSEIDRAARGVKFHLLRGAVCLVGISLAARQIDPTTMRWAFDGIGGTLAVELLSRPTRAERSPGPFTYLALARDLS